MKTEMFAQHKGSNYKAMTDHYLLPTSYDFIQSVEDEIDTLKSLGDYICITNETIGFERGLNNNVETFGDCLSRILKERLDTYKGQDYWEESSEETLDSFCEGATMKPKKANIKSILYSEIREETYYFIGQ